MKDLVLGQEHASALVNDLAKAGLCIGRVMQDGNEVRVSGRDPYNGRQATVCVSRPDFEPHSAAAALVKRFER